MATPTTPVELTEIELDFLKTCLAASKKIILYMWKDDPTLSKACQQQLEQCRRVGNRFAVAQHKLMAERSNADIVDF